MSQAQVIEELRVLRAAIDELREEHQHSMRRMLARQDRRDLAELLPLVHAFKGSATWTAAGLVRDAMDDPAARQLLAVLVEWNTEAGGLRALGHLLQRGAGTVFGGLRLVELRARDRDGAMYQVERLSPALEVAQPVARDVAIHEHG